MTTKDENLENDSRGSQGQTARKFSENNFFAEKKRQKNCGHDEKLHSDFTATHKDFH